MRTKFDLVIAFIGSAACSPVLEELMAQNWDPRFFFSKWNTDLVDRLLEQQEGLKKRGIERHIMILMDDVVLDSKASDQIANCGMRGRHFNVSIMACAVSYTTLPKKFRRSLDALLVFSCPMTGDMQILTWEFSRRASMARYALESLEEHQCLVLETLQPGAQRLFSWRADHITVDSLLEAATGPEDPAQSGSSPAGARSSTAAADGSCAAGPRPPRSAGTAEGPGCTRWPASDEAPCAPARSGRTGRPESPRSAAECPR